MSLGEAVKEEDYEAFTSAVGLNEPLYYTMSSVSIKYGFINVLKFVSILK